MENPLFALVIENDIIVIEDLHVKGMVKNKKLAKSMSNASFATFRSQLTYKCAWYGKELVPQCFLYKMTC